MIMVLVFKVRNMVAKNLDNFTQATVSANFDGIDVSFEKNGYYPFIGVKRFAPKGSTTRDVDLETVFSFKAELIKYVNRIPSTSETFTLVKCTEQEIIDRYHPVRSEIKFIKPKDSYYCLSEEDYKATQITGVYGDAEGFTTFKIRIGSCDGSNCLNKDDS